jgi:RNA polymerase sigma-70 factor (ECF subfamily)
MRRVRGGDAAAFATIYERHSGAAYALASRMLPAAAAEDVVQESFLSLWRTGAYDPSQTNLRGYLLAIVRNRAVDRMRKDRRQLDEAPIDEALEERLPCGHHHTHDRVERSEVARHLRAAVASLPEAQRHALELAYFGGLSQTEIAGHLEVPLGTIKGRLRLALKRLQRDDAVLACR